MYEKRNSNSKEIQLNKKEVEKEKEDRSTEYLLSEQEKEKEKEKEESKMNEPIQLSSLHKRERLYWVDALRVLANFLVVFIHCTGVDLKPVPFKSRNWKYLYFYNGLAKPCVPLFIMISGLLFLDPNHPVTYHSLYKKSIPRLLRSYLFWSCYYSVINDMLININEIQYHFSRTLLRDTLKKCILGGGHLWYLNFAMGLYILTPIFRELVLHPSVAWYTTSLSVIFGQFLPTVWDFLDTFTRRGGSVGRDFCESLRLSPITSYINYFMLGYLLNVNRLTQKWQLYTFYGIGILGIGLTSILRFIGSYRLRRESPGFNDNNSFNVTMATVGIFIFFKYTIHSYLLKRWRKEEKEKEREKEKEGKKKLIFFKFKNILIHLSDCSFGIYLIHMTVYHILYKLKFHPQSFNPLFCAPIYSVLVYLLSFLCTSLLRKFPIIKYFV